MRIIKNREIVERQTQNLIYNEMSNTAMVLQAPVVLTDYYSIDADISERMSGMLGVHEFINPESTIGYNKIENLPLAGVDNLRFVNEYDEEVGLDTDFTSSGVVFPNTVEPKPGDCFIVLGSRTTALYTIYSISHPLVHDMPTIAIEFRLLSQSQAKIDQLEKQVVTRNIFTVSNVGTDKNAVITKEEYFTARELVERYISIQQEYKDVFFETSRGIFMYTDILDIKDQLGNIVDAILLKMMFEEGVICYDPVITYATNNYEYDVEKVFIDSPETVKVSDYKRSIIYSILKRNTSATWADYRYPFFFDESPQLTKNIGNSVYVVEKYQKIAEDYFNFSEQFNIFDDEVVDRFNKGILLPGDDLMNEIIKYYKGMHMDYALEISYLEHTSYNFYLIPMYLYILRLKIEELIKGK